MTPEEEGKVKQIEADKYAIIALADAIREDFDQQEIRLMRNCITYEENDPAGLPGHKLILLVAKLIPWAGIDEGILLYLSGKLTLEEYIASEYWQDALKWAGLEEGEA